MNIISHDKDCVRKIIVQNELENKRDIIKLLALLKTTYFVEINFVNIQTIPKKIVITLKERIENIQIFTNEATLKSYLMNLGFNLTFQDNYKNKLKNLNMEYIAIGGSAGSLKKIMYIIENLPKSNLTLFIIMHQKADKKSSLANILQTCTSHYKVVEAQSDTKIENATIYVAPAGKHMIAAGGFIFLTNEERRNFSIPSISTTFESLALEYKNSLLAILVCGYGADGSDALKILNENDSCVILEDPSECKAQDMLKNAIKTNNYDYIYKLEEISKFIEGSLEHKFFTDNDLKKFLDKIYSKYGYDYRGYSLSHIKRRVHLFYGALNPKSFYEFENIVLENKNIFKDLFLNLSVNITTFYRNPEVFKILKNDLLPKLDSFMDIKIWCAGCSSGEEPYSIAIFLKELGLLDRSLIYATDINDVILKNAQNGLYSKENYNLFLKHYYQAGGDESFSKYFKDHDKFVEINDELKEKILFFRHNLALDAKINDFQLIFCRNVLIYFDRDLKERIFSLFKESLDSYGFLVLGESESLDSHIEYKAIDKKNKIYKRKI